MLETHLVNSIDLSHKLFSKVFLLDHPRRSVLGLSVFYFLAMATAKSETLSVKSLLADTGAPMSGLRRLVRDFESEGWVVSDCDLKDLRVRLVRPTDKFVKIVESIALHHYEAIGNHELFISSLSNKVVQ